MPWSGEERKRRRIECRMKCIQYLGAECVDCGETDRALLEFDHVRGTKSDNVASMMLMSWDRIKIELDKCELRCLDCHAVKDGRLHQERWGEMKRDGKSSRNVEQVPF